MANSVISLPVNFRKIYQIYVAFFLDKLTRRLIYQISTSKDVLDNSSNCSSSMVHVLFCGFSNDRTLLNDLRFIWEQMRLFRRYEIFQIAWILFTEMWKLVFVPYGGFIK